jgi:hypothetical protein
LAFTATEREETKTATSRTRITAQTASRVARAWLDPDPKPAPRTIHGACKDAGTRNAVRRERSVLLPVFPREVPYALRRCLGEVGKARLHSWGCRRWISAVASKPKAAQVDRDSPPRRNTLHRRALAKTAGTEIAELEERRPVQGTRAS